MVTQIGDAGYPSTDGDEVVRRARNRQRAVLPPVIETSRTVPSSPTFPPSPSRRDASRLQYRTPQPSPHTYQRPDPELFIPTSPPSTLNQRGNAPLVRPSHRSPTFPSANEQGTNTQRSSAEKPVEHPVPLGTRPYRPPLRTSMSTPQLNSKGPSHYRPYYPYQSDTSPRGLALPRFPQSPMGLRSGEKGRSSAQSALTSCSSIEQASGTERSSVLTKASSITDSSPETPDVAFGNDGGMSVEDAISMYLDGFSDDPPDEPENNGKEGADDGSGRMPAKYPEVTNNQMEDVPESPELESPVVATPVSEAQNSTPMLTKIATLSGTVPPPLSAETDVRDRYGFRKATSHIDVAQYDSWNKPYSEYLKQRKLKWIELLRENGQSLTQPTNFPSNSTKMRRYIRKGIPPEYRGAAWFWYGGGHTHLQRNPGLYNKLVEQSLKIPSNDDKEHIERDLHRTFPDNIHFKPDRPPSTATDPATSGYGSSNPKYCSNLPETPIIHSLRRVLYAFSLHNAKIGYTQSLNFIAGLLLLFLPEEKAFWMLHVITSNFLPGTHEISLEGANVDLWILMVVLKESLPAIYTKVASTSPTTSRSKPPALTVTTRLPDITLGLTNWLMSMFIGSLPFETTLRVWDIFFYEGSKTFFSSALAIFKASEKEIAAVSDPMEVFQIVQSVPKKLIDANIFADDCFSRKFRLRQNRVDELRDARRKIVRAEKVRVSMLHANGKTRTDIDSRSRNVTSPLPGLERGMVDSWRNLRHHAFK